MSEREAILARKADLALKLKEMKASEAYRAVMDRVAERCGSGVLWWKAWVLADEKKAALLRQLARGYLAFDELVEQMIHEGDIARQTLKGNDSSSSPASADKEQ